MTPLTGEPVAANVKNAIEDQATPAARAEDHTEYGPEALSCPGAGLCQGKAVRIVLHPNRLAHGQGHLPLEVESVEALGIGIAQQAGAS